MTRAAPGALVAAVTLVWVAATACGTPTPSAAVTTRTVVDMTGRAVPIPTVITRVATNAPFIPATMALLGGIDTVVAAADGSFNTLFGAVAPMTATIPRVRVTALNGEDLLARHPQVFLMTDMTPNLLPALDRLHIPVVQFGAITGPAQLHRSVRLVAEILGGQAPARAERYLAFARSLTRRVRAAVGSLPPAARPTVYYCPGPEPTTTVGVDNIITAAITAAGGRNVAAEHGVGARRPGAFAFPSVSAETLLAWDPDVIVTIDADIAGRFRTDPRFSGLTAIRTGRLYACPVGVFPWCAASSEAALAPMFLATALHPHRSGPLSPATAVAEFYARFYGYRLSDGQVSAILRGGR